jgi:hypothetical protein
MRSQGLPAPNIHLGDDPDPTQELGQRMAGAAQTAQGLLTNYLFYGQRRRAEARDHNERANSAENSVGRGHSAVERRTDLPIALSGVGQARLRERGAEGEARRLVEEDTGGTILRFGLRAPAAGRDTTVSSAAAVQADPLAFDALAAVPNGDHLVRDAAVRRSPATNRSAEVGPSP